MDQTLVIILFSALSVGLIHTLIGPDHYVPFIALSASRSWSLAKTMAVTALCGIAHVLSAVLLGLAAAAAGSVLIRLDFIESLRGSIAAWMLTSFGFAYCVWGIHYAVKNKKYGHAHGHSHGHSHGSDGKKELTPWILFVIFLFGPCEPLIPLVMYPAVQKSAVNVLLVTLVFGSGTLAVMLSLVAVSFYGMKRFPRFPFFERFGNALAGGVLCASGLAVTYLGL